MLSKYPLGSCVVLIGIRANFTSAIGDKEGRKEGINQSMDQSMDQSINQSMNQSIVIKLGYPVMDWHLIQGRIVMLLKLLHVMETE